VVVVVGAPLVVVPEVLDHFLDLLDARELADSWTTKDGVEASRRRSPNPTSSRPRGRPPRDGLRADGRFLRAGIARRRCGRRLRIDRRPARASGRVLL